MFIYTHLAHSVHMSVARPAKHRISLRELLREKHQVYEHVYGHVYGDALSHHGAKCADLSALIRSETSPNKRLQAVSAFSGSVYLC